MRSTTLVRRAVMPLCLAVMLTGMAVTGSIAADLSLVHTVQGVAGATALLGEGFWPGENVSVAVTIPSEQDPLGELVQRFIATADQEGRFTSDFPLDGGLADATTVQLNALGRRSGLKAQLSINVSSTRLSVTSSLPAEYCIDTLTESSSLTVCAVVEQRCADNSYLPLPNRWVVFFVNTESCPGSSASKRPSDSALTDESGVACYTVQGLDTLYATGSYSVEVKFREEAAPDADEPPNGVCGPDERLVLRSANDCRETSIIERCLPPIQFTPVQGDSADVYYLTTADFDRDNETDVVFTGLNTEGLFIAFGMPGTGLEAPLKYASIRQAAITADFVNEDTLIDLIATNTSTVYVLLNQSNRSFSVDSIPLVQGLNDVGESQAGEVPSLITGYFTADNELDAVVAPGFLLVGDGSGGFGEVRTLPFPISTVDVCDFNADGRDDLVTSEGDSARIYLNDGLGGFAQAGTMFIGEPQLEIAPIETVADLNRDGWCDFALVVPLAGSSEQSLLTVGVTDRTGAITMTDTKLVAGIAYDITTADIDQDNNLEIVVTNGTTNQIEVYFGDGTGRFEGPSVVSLGSGGFANYALASLDMDRDGNSDLISGGLGGGTLVFAIDDQSDKPVLFDEMSTAALDGSELEVVNPNGAVISDYFRTVAGSAYQDVDLNNDGMIDARTLDFNLQYGEYTISITEEPGLEAPQPVNIGIGIDGSLQAVAFLNYTGGYTTKTASDADTTGVLIFHYTVEPESSIEPPNGLPVPDETPEFAWHKLTLDLPAGVTYQFQLDRYFDFRSPIFDTSGLPTAAFTAPSPLGSDSVFYWRFRSFDNGIPSEYSRTFAAFVSGVCCFGRQGNVNGDAEGLVDLSDAISLVNYVFLNIGDSTTICYDASDMDGDPSAIPDLGDVMALLNYLFLNGAILPPCP